MARRPKSYNLVKSNTPAYILGKLRTADIEDLRELHRHLTQRVSTNMTKLQQKGLTYSPAYRSLENKMKIGRVTPLAGIQPKLMRQGDEKSKLIQDIYAYAGFVKGKTHTVTGATQWDKSTNNRLGTSYSNATEKQKRGFWRLYEEYRAQIGAFAGLSSNEIQKEAWDWWAKNKYQNKTAKRVEEFFDNFLSGTYSGPAPDTDDFMGVFSND